MTYGERRLSGELAAAQISSPDILPSCENARTVYEELYGPPVNPQAVREVCYDARGHSFYVESLRTSYWPFFTHPRWLSCRQLYCRV